MTQKTHDDKFLEKLTQLFRDGREEEACQILRNELHIDKATGILSGRGTADMLERLDKKTNPIGLFYIDINGLSEINNGPGGHESGDEAIERTGIILSDHIRLRTIPQERNKRYPPIKDKDLLHFIHNSQKESINIPEYLATLVGGEKQLLIPGRSYEKGDEFLATALNVKTFADVKNIGIRLRDTFNNDSDAPPVSIGGFWHYGSLSMEEALKKSERAMYHAKAVSYRLRETDLTNKLTTIFAQSTPFSDEPMIYAPKRA